MKLAGKVTIFSIHGCRYCSKAKSVLTELQIPYFEVNLDDYNDEVRANLKSIAKSNTVPQIFFNDKLIGGSDDLDKLVADKTKFDELLNYVKVEKCINLTCLPDESQKKSVNDKSDIEWSNNAVEFSEQIRQKILQLYDKYLSNNGKSINYSSMKNDELFHVYVKMTHHLKQLDISGLDREGKLAFFLNIYNVLVIHSMVDKGPPSNLLARWKFFNYSSYIIGGMEFSLQDIENGVLRANQRGVGMICRPFSTRDKRLAVALDQPEPLIHFALVCGAKSCPPIKIYSAQNIMDQLKTAGESFLEDDQAITIDAEQSIVHLSQIFQWYSIDFGQDKIQILKWISNHMIKGSKLDQLNNLLSCDNPMKSIQVKYLKYDWSANSSS